MKNNISNFKIASLVEGETHFLQNSGIEINRILSTKPQVKTSFKTHRKKNICIAICLMISFSYFF